MIVAVYEHKHGTDIQVFRTLNGAIEWKNAIAAEWWQHEIPDDVIKPDDPDKLGYDYFNWHSDHGDEYFTVQECELVDR